MGEVSVLAFWRPLIDCTAKRNSTSIGIPLRVSGSSSVGDRGRMKLRAKSCPVTGWKVKVGVC